MLDKSQANIFINRLRRCLFGIAVIHVIYASIITWLYYRKDITHALFFKRDQLREMVDALVKAVDLLPQVHEMVTELGLATRQAGEKKTLENELLFFVQQILKNYARVGVTEYKEKINEYISQELRKHASLQIEEEKLLQFWQRYQNRIGVVNEIGLCILITTRLSYSININSSSCWLILFPRQTHLNYSSKA